VLIKDLTRLDFKVLSTQMCRCCNSLPSAGSYVGLWSTHTATQWTTLHLLCGLSGHGVNLQSC